MQAPANHPQEDRRLVLLEALKVLDSPPVEELDRVTRLAGQLFAVPISVISLIDRYRQWFKSRIGLDVPETTREISFCGHTILQEGCFVVPDARLDQRFADNPLVTGQPSIAFYAGHPIYSREGLPLGTLCIIDSKPRDLDPAQQKTLQDLAAMAEHYFHELELATVSRELQSDLMRSEAQFENVFAHAAVGIAMVSPAGRWLRANPHLCTLLGYEETEICARRFQDFSHPDEHEDSVGMAREVLDGGRPDYTLDKRFRHKDGHYVWMAITVSLVRDRLGRPDYFIAVIRDVTEQKSLRRSLIDLSLQLEVRVKQRTAELQKAYEEIKKLSITDELTGLYNRRGFYMLAQPALRQLARRQERCSILYMDLDGLKLANDEYGHDAGNALLVNAAQVLKQTCREADIVARLGGDEFCVLAQDGGSMESLRQRVRQGMADFNRAHPLECPLQASVGLCNVAVDEDSSLDQMLAAADALMYEEKRQKKTGGTDRR